MPLSKDEKGGGSEVNGNISLKFRSHCYEDEKFTNPQMTMDERNGISGFYARVFYKGDSKTGTVEKRNHLMMY